ncbi:hypothetical protein [Actinomadura sp. WMMB 499]|uniref:hypothetical protein n=1 Tax=Actinomadura sp. WMMB 499 TaxID=1219491 RepID=UPI001248421E|nr:hypothetical protein [Actinomadura sp. WMMB 499]QFG20814.1 hypothetical protein F7P10_06295 [Actinomadura sp. WMMB 499]
MTFDVVRGSLPLELRGIFRPWALEVGHSKVLLRGFLGAEDGGAPRVFDVLFQDVSRISLADQYSGLRVSAASAETMHAEERRTGSKWRDSTLYHVAKDIPCDYVVAGYLFWAEVRVGARERSPLLDEDPDPGSVVGGRLHRI